MTKKFTKGFYAMNPITGKSELTFDTCKVTSHFILIPSLAFTLHLHNFYTYLSVAEASWDHIGVMQQPPGATTLDIGSGTASPGY